MWEGDLQTGLEVQDGVLVVFTRPRGALSPGGTWAACCVLAVTGDGVGAVREPPGLRLVGLQPHCALIVALLRKALAQVPDLCI